MEFITCSERRCHFKGHASFFPKSCFNLKIGSPVLCPCPCFFGNVFAKRAGGIMMQTVTASGSQTLYRHNPPHNPILGHNICWSLATSGLCWAHNPLHLSPQAQNALWKQTRSCLHLLLQGFLGSMQASGYGCRPKLMVPSNVFQQDSEHWVVTDHTSEFNSLVSCDPVWETWFASCVKWQLPL